MITEIQYERAAKVEEITALCNQLNISITQVTEPARVVNSFLSRNADECLVVLGSMYLLGEIKQQLLVGVA
jgi:folylpolyglutamate synthase/dihydropteroate synthase